MLEIDEISSIRSASENYISNQIYRNSTAVINVPNIIYKIENMSWLVTATTYIILKLGKLNNLVLSDETMATSNRIRLEGPEGAKYIYTVDCSRRVQKDACWNLNNKNNINSKTLRVLIRWRCNNTAKFEIHIESSLFMWVDCNYFDGVWCTKVARQNVLRDGLIKNNFNQTCTGLYNKLAVLNRYIYLVGRAACTPPPHGHLLAAK